VPRIEHRDCPLALIADTDLFNRFLVGETLKQAGLAVEEVENLNSVITAFQRLSPDIVMLDAGMPDLAGFSVCEGIRELSEGYATPVIIMTGLDDIESVKRAYGAGATDIISKPVNTAVLSYRVHYILRSSRVLESLRLSEARLAEAQRIAKIGSWEHNILTGEMFWSEEAYRLLGMESIGSRISSEHFRDAADPDGDGIFEQSLRNIISEGKSFSTDLRIVRPDGEERYIHVEAQINKDETGRPVWTVGYVQDITERKQTEKKIRRLAYYDTVTDLPNRTLFRDYFNHAIALAKRSNRMMAILFIDLDRFKQINDTFGHTIGDDLLKQVAERLRNCVREGDYVSRDIIQGTMDDQDSRIARFAGDEFLVLLENINDYYDAAKVAQRIKDKLSLPYEIRDNEISVTSSIGIGIYPLDGDNLDDIIKHSDIAMYHAKEMGRNNFQFYSDSLNTAAMNHLVLESQLRKAILRDELFLRFQPIVDLRKNYIFCAEVLVRWQHPDLGELQPSGFIPMAEETGLITEIDEWVLHNACVQAKAWQESGFPAFKISVNISGRHFRKKKLLETIDRVVNNTGINPAFLELEITEGVLMKNDPDTISILHGLKEKGIRLSIDDFGTGYSSLSYLKRFPLDILKIDRSFVKDILTDPDSASITSAIIAMAGGLKLETIAEGVETREQMGVLLESGCWKMQGYYFSPPLGALEFEEYLSEQKAQGEVIHHS
jgi:diguanylate cyclase (GGDEF)-like protein/PAS domain S-box-containing protein